MEFIKFFISLTVIMFSSLWGFSQCADGADLGKNGNCIYLSWTNPPNPLPGSITQGTEAFNLVGGNGSSVNPAVYQNNNNCAAAAPDPFTGDIIIGNSVCSYNNGTFTGSITLPLELLDFDTRRQANSIQIEIIATVPTIDKTQMILERSIDLINWKMLYEETISSSDDVVSIAYNDHQPLSGLNYYRVSFQDQNGIILSSKTVQQYFEYTGSLGNLEYHPNPVGNVLNIKFSGEAFIRRVMLYDQMGQIMSTLVPTTGEIDLSYIPNGIYILKVFLSDGQILTERIIK
jgi:hypothetical protein